jgi:hypothetical protein
MARVWRRPQPDATRPNRSFGGYYRTADRDIGAQQLRGIPIQTAEAAAVAAVRAGYNIVDAQIERGVNLARRLRSSADRAGVPETGQVLSLAENLLNKGAMLGLEMLETAAGDQNSPVKRLLTAQFRLLGSFLGVETGTAAQGRERRETEETPAGGRHDSHRSEGEHSAAVSDRVRVLHRPDSAKRAVTVVRFTRPTRLHASRDVSLVFHPVSGSSQEAFSGTLTFAPKEVPLLEVATTREQPGGLWRAAICTSDGEQVGIIEVDL